MKDLISGLIVGAVVVGIISLVFIAPGNNKIESMSIDEVETKTIKYINSNLLQGEEATVKEIVKEDGLYKIVVNLPSGQEATSYVTMDGGKFFPQAINMNKEADENTDQDSNNSTETVKTKSNNPKVELFTMSHCPYGTQIEKGILPVLETLGDKIDFKLKF